MCLFLSACGFTFEIVKDVSGAGFSENTHTAEPDGEFPLFFEGYINVPLVNFTSYRENVQAKGIYMTANTTGLSAAFADRLDFMNTTELNALVIDVRDEFGNVTFKNKIAFADELGVSINYIPNIDAVLKNLNHNGIYPIARVVVFKDYAIHKTRPDFVTKLNDGSLYFETDSSGKQSFCWLNPYNRDVWEYVVDIAVEAAKLGFKEIQFDYVRFPTDSNSKNADYGDTGGMSKTEIIAEFGKYAMERLKPYGVTVSADIFGTVIISDLDASLIGQDFLVLSEIFDVLCPMVYPSHYAENTMGIANPDLSPYEIVNETFRLANRKLSDRRAELQLEGKTVETAVIRPWLQDFTATWLKTHAVYSGRHVRDQIQACYNNGITEWLLWDPTNRYAGAQDGGVLSAGNAED